MKNYTFISLVTHELFTHNVEKEAFECITLVKILRLMRGNTSLEINIEQKKEYVFDILIS